MDILLNINTNNLCKIIIKDNSNYLTENSNVAIPGSFKKSLTTSIVILQHHQLSKDTINSYISTDKYIELPIEFDGYFTIYYIIIPNKEWYDNASQAEKNSYSTIYYSDGVNIYTLDSEIVPIEEIMLRNIKGTTISRHELEHVSVCNLLNCYINLCLLIFNSRGFSKCWNKNSIDSELIFKRDLVWMALNVIDYLTSLHTEDRPTLSEVQRIVETINGCNGLCKSVNTNTIGGCGCSK